jgi:hypothetical protein
LRQKESPSSVQPDKGADTGVTLAKGITTKKFKQYASRKRINCQIGVILGTELDQPDLQKRLIGCGHYLEFRHYLETGNLKLSAGYYCNMHMLCPCCSAARSRRLLAKYLPLLFDTRHSYSRRHYMLTLTWPPPSQELALEAGPGDLKASLAIGMKAWGKLWKRRTNRRTGPLQDVLGAILSVEVTKGPSGKWHPHFHVLVTMPRKYRISAAELRHEWDMLTGGRQLRLDPLLQESDVVEVFKYAVKPADLDKRGHTSTDGVRTRFQIYQALKGARLIRGFGCYFNVQDVDLRERESVEDLGKWMDLMFRWSGSQYELWHVLGRKDSDNQVEGGDLSAASI